MKKYLHILIILFLLSACASNKYDDKVVIILSKGSGSEHYAQYGRWLESFDDDIECVDVTYIKFQDQFDKILSKASGIVLTGGPDVHPGRYGKEYDTLRCYLDPSRDSLEFFLIEYAKKNNLPVLGICRGMQILNVAYGGTLFVDIPEDYGTEVLHSSDSSYCFHEVTFKEDSYLYNLTGKRKDSTNSYHHQGVEKLSDVFVVKARTNDGFIEGIEWKEKIGKPYLLAVQWHPERYESNTSKQIALDFIEHCKRCTNFDVLNK